MRWALKRGGDAPLLRQFLRATNCDTLSDARIIVPQEGYGCPSREQGGLLMPTEREKQAEKERVTRISGFRVGYHDFLAEVDLDALKKRNDRWEAEHRHQSLLDRKTDRKSTRLNSSHSRASRMPSSA